MMNEHSFILMFLQIRAQIQLFHWQTPHYGAHKAFDEFNEVFAELVDKFVEAYQGKNAERVKVGEEADLVLYDMGEYHGMEYLDDIDIFLEEELEDVVGGDSELKNIVDEMRAEVDKLRYLLSLK
jgi:hypothetical protein